MTPATQAVSRGHLQHHPADRRVPFRGMARTRHERSNLEPAGSSQARRAARGPAAPPSAPRKRRRAEVFHRGAGFIGECGGTAPALVFVSALSRTPCPERKCSVTTRSCSGGRSSCRAPLRPPEPRFNPSCATEQKQNGGATLQNQRAKNGRILGRASRRPPTASARCPKTGTVSPGASRKGAGAGRVVESGRWDSNPRRPAWEAGILPLNYARILLLP